MTFLENSFLSRPIVKTSIPLNSPLHETFRVLGLGSNLASVQVLGRALASPNESVRHLALQTLIHRGGQAEMSAILERIDNCNETELPFLANHVSTLIVPIEMGLGDRNPLKRQRSLCAIAKLQIASQFHHLVHAAQSPNDPQQIVAAELVLGLACKLGAESRRNKGRTSNANRERLLSDLWQSMLLFDDHRISQIVDAWLCASHWEDQAFKELFKPARSNPVFKFVTRQLKRAHRAQITELLAGVLWSQAPRPEAVQELGERTEQAMAVQLAEYFIKFGITPMVTKNLAMKIPIQCIEQLDFADNAVSLVHRCALVQLLAAADTSPDKIIFGITKLLETRDVTVDLACSNAIRSHRSLKPEIVVMVLSDCFDAPGMKPYEPPPWKSRLRIALERLIELYPHQAPAVQSSIEFIFSDFRCEELIKHLDDWPESHLMAYAKIVRIAEVGFVEFIERDAQSQSAVKRSRAIHAVRFLGMDNGLADITLEAIEDKSEKVRIEAIYAITTGRNRNDAIEILLPLIRDEDQSVKTAANFALSSLRT